jgi:hypothetical protein
MRTSARHLLTLALGIALLGSTSCSSYHYVVVDVKLDTTLAANGTSSTIQLCYAVVTNEKGGVEDSFPLAPKNSPDQRCPVSGSSIGKFEYSTLKDSGTLKFKVTVYDTLSSVDEACKMGEGEVDVPIKATSNDATLTVMAIGNGAGCQ